MSDEWSRRSGEKTSDYFARLSGICADAAEKARLSGDKEHLVVCIVKAAELLQAARAFQQMEQATK